jgi:hypothetical protein
MQRAAMLLMVLLIVTACSGGNKETSGGGLTARVLEPVGDGFDRVIAGTNHLYAFDGGDAQRIDPATGEPMGSEFRLYAIHTRRAVADDGAVWFTSTDGEPPDRRISPGGADDALILPEGYEGFGVAVSGETGWINDPRNDVVVPFTKGGVAGDPITVVCDLTYDQPVGTPNAVWVTCENGLARIDSKTRQVSMVTDQSPGSLAMTSSALWVRVKDKLLAVDESTGKVMRTQDVPAGAGGIVGNGDYVWMVRSGEQDGPTRITLHDASDLRQIAGPVELPDASEDAPASIQEVVAFGDRLWITQTYYNQGLIVIERAG